ncbi:MAG: TRAP transporter small permease [Desulfobacterales bacterium]|nr:TRAP transporter small permease [Desulfobacterales bacterium]
MKLFSGLSGLARSITSVIDRGSVILSWAAIAALLLMMLITGADVLLRFVFRVGMRGAVEVTGNYLIVAVFALPMAYGLRNGGHINVDMVVERFGVRLRAAFETVTYFLALVVYVMITVYGAEGALDAIETGDRFVNMHLPMWPGRALVAVAGLFLCLQMVLCICRSSVKVFGKTDLKEATPPSRGD